MNSEFTTQHEVLEAKGELRLEGVEEGLGAEPEMIFIDAEQLQSEAAFILKYLEVEIVRMEEKKGRKLLFNLLPPVSILDLISIREALRAKKVSELPILRIEMLQALRDHFMRQHGN